MVVSVHVCEASVRCGQARSLGCRVCALLLQHVAQPDDVLIKELDALIGSHEQRLQVATVLHARMGGNRAAGRRSGRLPSRSSCCRPGAATSSSDTHPGGLHDPHGETYGTRPPRPAPGSLPLAHHPSCAAAPCRPQLHRPAALSPLPPARPPAAAWPAGSIRGRQATMAHERFYRYLLKPI